MTIINVDKLLEDAVTQSVKKLVQTVGDNVKQIRGIGSEIKGLSDDIETFNARLVDAFKNPRANELQLLEVILRKFQTVVNDTQDAVENYTNLMKKHEDNFIAKGWDHLPVPIFGIRNVKACASEIQSIRTRMKTIRQDHEIDLRSLMNFKNTALSPTQVGPVAEEDCLEGFDVDLIKIKDRLNEAPDKFVVISIVGIPGAGKTTFAKRVLKDLGNNFHHCIWVHVSKGADIRQKFIDILNVVEPAENFSNSSEEVLKMRIKDKALKDEKYFVVVDDIWEKNDWISLKTALPESKGSRVLVTTRNQSVADSIEGYSHSLPELKPGVSWSLLEKIVFGKKGGCSNKSLRALGETIAGKCKGLPLAIVVIAGILRKCRTVADWRRVAENPFLEINRKDQLYHKIVMLSCNQLPHEKLKNCFLYFASFPMGHKIPARKLIRLWVAEDFILKEDDRGGYPVDVEVEARKYLSDLVDRNLVRVSQRSADGQIKVCSILDSLHEFCKIEAAKKNLFYVMDGRHTFDVKAISPRRLCYHFITSTLDAGIPNLFEVQNNNNDASPFFVAILSRFIKKKTSTCSYGKHVHSLLLSSSPKSENQVTQNKQLVMIPNTFPLLRVLDIESHNFSLPHEFYSLEHLRYLAIQTDLDLQSKPFKNFRALETLIFKTEKKRVEIPQGIWDMEKLRHVCINTSAHLPSPPMKSKSSSDIRTLSTISPKSCTEEIFNKTPKLQKLGVRGNLSELLRKRQGTCLFDNIHGLNFLENLKLHGESGKVSNVPIPDKFPCKLRKLTLSNTLFDWNDIRILATLDDLEVLKLDDNAFTGEIWDLDNDIVFEQLQYLRIGRSNLVTWTAEEISFPVLECLVLKNCTCLLNTPDFIDSKEGPDFIDSKEGLKVHKLFDGSEKAAANSAKEVPSMIEKDYAFGFDEDLEKVKTRLSTEAPDKFIFISIVGMLGSGKTTFGTKIFEDSDFRKKFDHCIRIDVPRKKILIDMLHGITGSTEDFSNTSEEQLKGKLKNFLKVKKWFILMDNVWEKEEWDCLKAAFPENLEGIIRVLVTTRVHSVAEYIGESCSLSVLCPDDSWLLLEKKVFGEEGCIDDSFTDIGKEIARKCNGLPLAIVSIARILSVSRTTDSWKRVAENPFLEIYHKDQRLNKAVMLYLNEKVKNCFLYFACFPKGKEIPAGKLIRLWIAEGLIPTTDEQGNTLDMEVEAQKYLDGLADKNIVRVLKRRVDGRIKTCRIDDSLHEFCKNEAAKKDLFQVMDGGQGLDLNTISSPRLCFHSSVPNIFVVNETQSSLFHILLERIFINCCNNKMRSPNSSSEYVHSLLLSSTKKSEVHLTQEQLATIRNTFPFVRVLDFESFKLSFQPNELFGLHHLRYLAITIDLSLLPKSFKNLCELETLVIRSTKSKLEIKDGIWNMEKLRHVLINTCAHLPSPPKTSKSSSEIHTLSTISPSSCTEEIFKNTPKLQKLGVRGNLAELLGKKQGICFFNNHLQRLSCLENLKLHHQSENVLKVPMLDKFPCSLRKLTLSNTLFEWNDMNILGYLELLEVLKLEENAFTGELWDLNNNVVFNRLQYLRIGRTNLVTWTVAKESFPVLQSLVIRNCTELATIPYSLAEVGSLEMMNLFHMSEKAIECAEWVYEQRRGKEDSKTFNLFIYPPKAAEHKQTHAEENVNAGGFDLANTSLPSKAIVEHKQTHGDANVNITGFDLPTTSILSQEIEQQTHSEENVSTNEFDFPSTSIPSQTVFLKAPEVVGFDHEVEMIMGRLLGGSNELTVISIEGMAGIGKTTLTKMVFTNQAIQHAFSHCIWVCVSQSFNRKEVISGILSDLTYGESKKFHDMSEDKMAIEIRKKLMGNRYFIVVDDIWSEHDWNSLKIVFPNDMTRSRVLITTRDHRVASYADSASNPHQLRFFTDEECWKLLKMKVFGDATCPPSLEGVGKSIATKCNGLPLVVVLISGILYRESKTPAVWERIAKDLSPVVNENSQTYNLVKLSYDDLPYYLKYCFLYLAVFPEDHEIAVWKLIRLWIAEGFISPMECGNTSDVERTAEKYLNYLVDRSLLMVSKRRADGQIKACRLHDMLHEFCKTEAAKENLFHEMDGAKLRGQETPRRICVHSSVLDFLKSESKPSGEHVRSFLSFSSEEIRNVPDYHLAAIPKSFPLLQVMDVESFKFKSLPKEFYQLYEVRYFAVSTDLNLLPKRFGDLLNMQTLVFNTSQKILEVAADIWSMSKLRHVHSNASMQLPPPSKVRKNNLGSTDIQTLSTISPSSCTREILEKTPNLQKLGIRGNLAELMESRGGISMFDNLQCLTHLDNLKLLDEANPFQGAKLLRVPQHDKFPSRLRKLTLSKTRFPWEHMCVLGALDELEVLKLEEYAFMGESWQLDEDIVFNSLRFLRIGKTDLVYWTISESCFPVLETLVIRDCTQLEEIPSNFVDVFTLKRLELHCTNPLAVNSALLIQKDQQDLGNVNFEVSIYP